jgi:glycosyltransferase involved in cell wall biosynthesis
MLAQRDALADRGDEARLLPERGGPLSALKALVIAPIRARYDVVVLHAAGTATVAAARALGSALAIDLSPPSDGLDPLLAFPLALELWAGAVIARTEGQYRELLQSGVPAYRLFLIRDAPPLPHFGPREAEPAIARGAPLRLVCHAPLGKAEGHALWAGFARLRAEGARVSLRVVGGGEGAQVIAEAAAQNQLGPELLQVDAPSLTEVGRALAEAHAAIAIGDGAGPALEEAWSVGLPAITDAGATAAPEAVERVDLRDPGSTAAAVWRIVRDKKHRQQLSSAAGAWRDEMGPGKQRALFLRVIDSLAAEKVAAQRRAKQAAVEGIKTGTRTDS